MTFDDRLNGSWGCWVIVEFRQDKIMSNIDTLSLIEKLTNVQAYTNVQNPSIFSQETDGHNRFAPETPSSDTDNNGTQYENQFLVLYGYDGD